MSQTWIFLSCSVFVVKGLTAPNLPSGDTVGEPDSQIHDAPFGSCGLPNRLRLFLAVPTFHSMIFMPSVRDIKPFPSGETVRNQGISTCPASKGISLPVAVSQRCTAPSSIPADARTLPSAENAMAVTVRLVVFQFRISLPVAESHSRTTQSLPADASNFPSGENATCEISLFALRT